MFLCLNGEINDKIIKSVYFENNTHRRECIMYIQKINTIGYAVRFVTECIASINSTGTIISAFFFHKSPHEINYIRARFLCCIDGFANDTFARHLLFFYSKSINKIMIFGLKTWFKA